MRQVFAFFSFRVCLQTSGPINVEYWTACRKFARLYNKFCRAKFCLSEFRVSFRLGFGSLFVFERYIDNVLSARFGHDLLTDSPINLLIDLLVDLLLNLLIDRFIYKCLWRRAPLPDIEHVIAIQHGMYNNGMRHHGMSDLALHDLRPPLPNTLYQFCSASPVDRQKEGQPATLQ